MPPEKTIGDLDPRFAVFLNPIRDLTKNWEVDIAKYLEEYLEDLSDVQITFNGGETVMNFAQAAILIQGSATVYSKKVEFLWQMVLQMLDLLASRASKDGTAGQAGGKGGRAAALDISLEFASADNITHGKTTDMWDTEDDLINTKKSLRLWPATPLHLVEKEGEKSKKRIALFVRGNELFGGKDDFILNRSYLNKRFMLSKHVPSDILNINSNMHDISQDIEENSPQENVDAEIPADSAPSQPLDPIPEDDEMDAPPDLDLDLLTGGDEEGEGGGGEEEKMDEDKDSADDKDEEKRDVGKDDNNLTVIDLPNGRYGLRRRGDKEKVGTLKLTEPWKPQDPYAETPAKRPVRTARLRRPPACACHRPTRQDRKKNSRKKEDEIVKKKTLSSVESFLTGELTKTVASNNNKNTEVPAEILDEVNRESKKRMDAGLKRRAREFIEDGGCKDVEEAIEKVVEEKEVEHRIDNQLDDPLDCDAPADLDLGDDNDDILGPPLFLPEPHNATQMPQQQERLNTSQHYDEPASDYEALVQKWVSEVISTAQEQVNSCDLVRRVNKWRENITPILKEEEGRQEFDIHSYGSQILSHFPDNGRKQTIPFTEIVSGQNTKEISRLFLSCLMLANTHNIELNESNPGDLAMDCLELTLLSRVRHHEELEDYYAPSQNTPRKKSGKNKEPATSICADITQVALAENNVPTTKTHARPKAKVRHR